jgi:hypothetical protein
VGLTENGMLYWFFSAMVGIGGDTFSVSILVAYRYPAHKALALPQYWSYRLLQPPLLC